MNNEMTKDIVNDYQNGESFENMVKKYDMSKTSLLKVISKEMNW